jgi:phosphatidylinositol-4,5-bisphosphate 4-phosphatase
VTDSKGNVSSFKGIRHGINSAYGMKGKTEPDKQARESASVARSLEVVAAALGELRDQKEIDHAIQTGQPMELRLTSTSLVTAMNAFGQSEGSQMKDQVGAWNALNQASRENGHILVPMRGKDDKMHQVKVKFEAAPMNFGVNEAALTQKLGKGDFSLKLNAGWNNADKVNTEGLSVLLGGGVHLKPSDGTWKPSAIGGWTRAYLEKNPRAANRADVETLSRQITQIWQSKSHREDKFTGPDGKKSAIGDPYKMAARVVVLSHEIGAAPCWNCKSGKDRTGALDGEVKFLYAYRAQHGYFPEPGAEFSGDTQELYRKCMMETGNGEIQKQNTGAEGNKVYKKLSFNNLSMADRLGQEVGDTALFDKMKGQSGHVKS